MEQYLQVGVIVSTHALKGEVKVYPTTEDVRRYDDLGRVFAASEADMAPYLEMGPADISENPKIRVLFVEHVRYFKNQVIVKFRDIDRIEDVQPYLKKNLYVAREDAIELGEDEYFVGDLIDLDVIDSDSGRLLGTLYDVMETGANDVYIVHLAEDPSKELLIPATEECIKGVDLQAGVITVHLLKGMLD